MSIRSVPDLCALRWETNQYCCNVGSFHVTRARAQVALIEDECVLRVLLGDDRSLVRAAVVAVGAEELESLATALAATGKLVQAAQITFARTFGESSYAALERQGAALALLARAGASDDAQRLELQILSERSFAARGEERTRTNARIEELLASNASLHVDRQALIYIRDWPRLVMCFGIYPSAWVSTQTLCACCQPLADALTRPANLCPQTNARTTAQMSAKRLCMRGCGSYQA